MALFENFPYTNLQQLNLNWIIKKLKELETHTVLSVNGETGNIVLYQSPSMQLPAITDVSSWAIWRNMDNRASGIQFTDTGVEWVDGSNRIKLLTSADIPSSSGVVAVNGQTGVVILNGENINVSETDTRTLAAAINALISTDNSLAADIVTLYSRIGTAETDIDTLETEAATMEGNIQQNSDDIQSLSDEVTDIQQAVDDLESGLNTTNQNVTALSNSVTNDFTWKLLGIEMGSTPIPLPATWRELHVSCRYGNTSGLQSQVVSFNILPIDMNRVIIEGAGNILCEAEVANGNVFMVVFLVSETDFIATSQITVYYR